MTIKVFHAPTTVGGNPQGLSRALNTLDLKSETLTLSQNYFQYPADSVLWNEQDGYFKRELKRLQAIFKLRQYDLVHYNFGTTLSSPHALPDSKEFLGNFPRWFLKLVSHPYLWTLQFFELTYLRFAKKPIFMTYQGSDARQDDYSLSNFTINIASQIPEKTSVRKDRFKRQCIERMSHFCDQIYSVNPDLLHVLPDSAKFIPYSHIFLEDWSPSYSQNENRPLRIIHAPSNRRIKGTDHIQAALNSLKDEGFDFEFILVENMSNSAAMEIYKTADVLIDQIFAGWYGGLAVELMALGKPVAAYIREEDLKFISSQMKEDLPIMQVSVDTLKEDLRHILTLPREELVHIGKKSRRYIETWHDPLKIAKQIKSDYDLAMMKRGKLRISNIRKKSLILCLADPGNNPRPKRAAELARKLGFETHMGSFSTTDRANIDYLYEIKKPSMRLDQRILRKIIGLLGLIFCSKHALQILHELRWGLSSLKSQAKLQNVDLIIVEDLHLLPLAFEIKVNAKIIFDAREYYPEQLGNNFLWRMTERPIRIKLCRDYLPNCDHIITVSDGLACEYKKNFNIDCELIRSAPHFFNVAPRKTQSSFLMVHHGVANRNRKLENMIDMFKYLDSHFHLDFYLVGEPGYVSELKERAKSYPQIQFREPVKFDQIVPMLNNYDIGLCYLEDNTFNLRHALPNKFFEFIQARLALAIGPSPDMAKLVRQYDLGVIGNSFEPKEMADTLNRLTSADLDRFKANSDRAAQELCWEKEKIKYIRIIQDLMAGR